MCTSVYHLVCCMIRICLGLETGRGARNEGQCSGQERLFAQLQPLSLLQSCRVYTSWL